MAVVARQNKASGEASSEGKYIKTGKEAASGSVEVCAGTKSLREGCVVVYVVGNRRRRCGRVCVKRAVNRSGDTRI